jgi:predicted O-methyltransferase YrrM
MSRQIPQDAGQAIWTRSDQYHSKFLVKKDAALEAALKKSHDNGLPDIAVSESQGKLLQLLARSISARSILEVGTLGG